MARPNRVAAALRSAHRHQFLMTVFATKLAQGAGSDIAETDLDDTTAILSQEDCKRIADQYLECVS